MRRLALAACVGLSGCWWIGGRSPESPPLVSLRSKCTSTYGLPIADTVIAGAAATPFVLVYSGSAKPDGLTLVYAIPLLIYGVSAISGYVDVTRCREIQHEQDLWRADHPQPTPTPSVAKMCEPIPNAPGGICPHGLHCKSGLCIPN